MTDFRSPIASTKPILGDAPYDDAATEYSRQTWSSGDFGRIAMGYARGAADFVRRLGLTRQDCVLDVGCGTGNATLPAARTGAQVTAIDIAANLVTQAQSNAAAEGLAIRYDVGNAEAMPYGDAKFDVTLSMFGSMFTAYPLRMAGELLRVTRRGGRIVVANWTAAGFVGRMLDIVGRYVAPPPSASPVLSWGDEAVARERLAGVSSFKCSRRSLCFEYPFPPRDTVRLFRDYYGPMVRTFAALDATGQRLLERDLITLWSDCNHSDNRTTRIESEYLVITAIR